MNITEVKMYPLTDSKTKALANIVIGGDFVVTGLKVILGEKGLFVAMPSKKNMKEDRTKDYYDIAFPITKEAREEIQNAVISKYEDTVEPHFPQPTKNKEQQEYDKDEDNGEGLPF